VGSVEGSSRAGHGGATEASPPRDQGGTCHGERGKSTLPCVSLMPSGPPGRARATLVNLLITQVARAPPGRGEPSRKSDLVPSPCPSCRPRVPGRDRRRVDGPKTPDIEDFSAHRHRAPRSSSRPCDISPAKPSQSRAGAGGGPACAGPPGAPGASPGGGTPARPTPPPPPSQPHTPRTGPSRPRPHPPWAGHETALAFPGRQLAGGHGAYPGDSLRGSRGLSGRQLAGSHALPGDSLRGLHPSGAGLPRLILPGRAGRRRTGRPVTPKTPAGSTRRRSASTRRSRRVCRARC
jgi:hypothetical protein